MPRRVRARVTLRPYDLVSEAVESGIAWGWQRAHKHTDTPTEEQVKDQIHRHVMNEICEVVDFEEAE